MRVYDTLKRTEIFKGLHEFDVCSKFSRFIKMSLRDTKYKVKAEGFLTESFEVIKGLRQDDPLSTILFNLIWESIDRESGIQIKKSIYSRSHQCISYADDIVILARNAEEIEEAFEKFKRATKDKGLEINYNKTKFMRLVIQLKKK